MIVTLATLATLLYLRHKIKNMWNKGQCRYIFGSIALVLIFGIGCIYFFTNSRMSSYSSVKGFNFSAMTNMAMRSVLKNDPLNRTLEVTHNPLEKGTGTPNDNKPLGATMNIVPKIPVTKKATIHLKHGIVKYSVKVVINEMNKMLRPYPQCSFLGYHRIIDSSLQIVEVGEPKFDLRMLNSHDERLNEWSTLNLRFETRPGHSTFLAKLRSSGKAVFDQLESIEDTSDIVPSDGKRITNDKYCSTNSSESLVNQMCVCEEDPTLRKEPYPNMLLVV